MDYFITVQAPAYPITSDSFATESAFAEHLRILREKTKSHFDRLVVATPVLDYKSYENNKHHLGEILAQEGIVLLPLHPHNIRFFSFWLKHSVRMFVRIWKQAKHSQIVHAGLADDIWRPIMFMSMISGWLRRKKTIFVVDIDTRNDAWMNYKTGLWSRKSYLLCRYIYDPLRNIQVRLAVRFSSLLMLKSARMVEDFGKNTLHVRNFFDAAHSADYIISSEQLQDKIELLCQKNRPLELAFFGRLVAYKGLDYAIKAIRHARLTSGVAFRLHIIGTGEKENDLRNLTKELEAEDYISFHDPLPYGPELFKKLGNLKINMTISTPLSEDTPRAAFDSMAAGLPILAFDTFYYTDLEKYSGCVATSEWTNIEALADQLISLNADRTKLIEMTKAAVAFAKDNTQEIWLDRRMQWTRELLNK